MTATSTNLETVTMETLASKTMLKTELFENVVHGPDRSVPDFDDYGHLPVSYSNSPSPCRGYLPNSDQFQLWYTDSEAMLISGASKQISSAIFYIFDLINLLKVGASIVTFIW